MRRLLLMVAIALVTVPATAADRVERRGQAGSLEGTVTRVGDDGVEITTTLEARHLVPWDRVRRVESRGHAIRLAELAPIADALWRARSRVERGDLAGAEPLLERLFERYRGQSSETALVVAEGLLRCRLARGEQALAVLPYLETVRLRRLGVTTDSYAALRPTIDAATMLCPLLPPLLPEGASVERMRRDLGEPADPVVRAMAAAYAAAPLLRRDGSIVPATAMPPFDEETLAHPGVRLLVAAVGAMSPSSEGAPDPRPLHVQAMRADPEAQPPFVAAWAALADGVALLHSGDPAMARRGVVRLLTIVAGHGRQLPWLAGSALLAAASAEAKIGDPAAAAVLRRELQSEHSHHPLVSAPVRRGRLAEEPS